MIGSIRTLSKESPISLIWYSPTGVDTIVTVIQLGRDTHLLFGREGYVTIADNFLMFSHQVEWESYE